MKIYKLSGYVFFFIILFAFVVSCSSNIRQDSLNLNQTDSYLSSTEVSKFKYLTKDGFEIHGALYKNKHGVNEKNYVLLLYGFGQNKSVYDNLKDYLVNEGFDVITLDYRGHGESIFRNNIELHSNDLTLDDFSSMPSDINGVLLYLEAKNISKTISIIGSDIGANIALNFAVKNNATVQNLILISPSLNYYGIKVQREIEKYFGSLYLVTSVDDSVSYEPSKILYDASKSEKKTAENFT